MLQQETSPSVEILARMFAEVAPGVLRVKESEEPRHHTWIRLAMWLFLLIFVAAILFSEAMPWEKAIGICFLAPFAFLMLTTLDLQIDANSRCIRKRRRIFSWYLMSRTLAVTDADHLEVFVTRDHESGGYCQRVMLVRGRTRRNVLDFGAGQSTLSEECEVCAHTVAGLLAIAYRGCNHEQRWFWW
jgi:hypothetical protein